MIRLILKYALRKHTDAKVKAAAQKARAEVLEVIRDAEREVIGSIDQTRAEVATFVRRAGKDIRTSLAYTRDEVRYAINYAKGRL